MSEKWILIVDDEESLLSILKSSLAKLGHEYRVVTAPDGYTALDQLKQFHFDLVVTDYKMAGMNGLELLDQIHQAQPDVRVILMTAYGNSSVEAEASRLKAYRYLSKPLEIETFRQVVKEATGNVVAAPHGVLVLSEQDYREVDHLLSDLQAAVGARCIFLTDSEGRYIAGTGLFEDMPLTKIASLLGGSLATLTEAGRMIDRDEDAINLAYREGVRDNLYVVNIGLLFLLIIVIERGTFSSRLGSVWYRAQITAADLREKFAGMKCTPPDDLLGRNLEEAFSGELRKILSIPKENLPIADPRRTALPPDEPPAGSNGPEKPSKTIWPSPPRLFSFDEARAKGILPPGFTDLSPRSDLEKENPDDDA